jgi:hypothetical protein
MAMCADCKCLQHEPWRTEPHHLMIRRYGGRWDENGERVKSESYVCAHCGRVWHRLFQGWQIDIAEPRADSVERFGEFG